MRNRVEGKPGPLPATDAGMSSDSDDSDSNGGAAARGKAIGKTMDGFSLDFVYDSLAPALIVAGILCMAVAYGMSSLLASLLGPKA